MPFKKLIICLLFLSIFIANSCYQMKDIEVVLVLLKTHSNPFFIEIERGIMNSWDNLDNTQIELHIRSGQHEGDINTHRIIIEQYYARYVEGLSSPRLRGLIITPTGSRHELTPYIKMLNDANVPVVIVDTRIDSDALSDAGAHYDAFIGSSNLQGGYLAGQLLMEVIQNISEPNILLLNGVEGHETAVARKEGFLTAIEEYETNTGIIVEITQRTCNWNRNEARSTVDGLIGIGNLYSGIFGANDEMALGALEALRQQGIQDIPIIGFDALNEARDKVESGELLATIAQDPYGMGTRAVEVLQLLWAGEDFDIDQIIEVRAVVDDE